MRTFTATRLAAALLDTLEAVPSARHGEVIRAFVRMLGRKHWLKAADRIVAAVLQAQDARAGRIAVTVTSARPLAHVEQLQKELAAALKTDIRLETAVDAALIGGATIQYGDTRLDASVQRSLAALKNRFAN